MLGAFLHSCSLENKWCFCWSLGIAKFVEEYFWEIVFLVFLFQLELHFSYGSIFRNTFSVMLFSKCLRIRVHSYHISDVEIEFLGWYVLVSFYLFSILEIYIFKSPDL